MKKNNRYVAGAMALATPVLCVNMAAAKQANDVRPNIVFCKLIRTAAQLQAMKNNLAASYCLAKDIDLRSIANFQPIGDDTTPFTGRLFGNNRVIGNLRIRNTTQQFVGLFGEVGGTAVIRDVSLVNVNIASTAADAAVGGLVGEDGSSSPITHVSVTGKIKCSGSTCAAGGIVGDLSGRLVNSWSAADVTSATAGGAAGGAVGISSNMSSSISDSFATGNVVCTEGCFAGGLLGFGSGPVSRSFATGSVSVPGGSIVGGLIGGSLQSTSQSFATGPVTAGDSSIVGGLIGVSQNAGNVIDQCYAGGRVQGGTGATLGGLIGVVSTATATNSYWDKNTTGQTVSAGGGTGLTTAQLRARLRAGFDPAVWAISKTLSYPFLNDADLDFASPLATLVRANKVFTFLPISQLDLSQYRFNPVHEGNASLAAVYTMVARAVGIADNVTQLRNVKIDRYFWHDPRQTTTFTGPITAHAALGVLKPLAANAKLTRANVIGKLDAQRLVILRGTFSKGGKLATHWMLGTLYTKGPGRRVNAVVANDPWTGSQVAIDPVSRTVVSPANFPLKNFKVNGYQPVLVH